MVNLGAATGRLSNRIEYGSITTEDAEEGINAFMEKRDPVWKER